MKNKIISGVIIIALLLPIMPVNALSKSETVYSKLNNDGSVKKTIVSEYLRNDQETINDQTNLKNILNLNGSETYKLEGTNIVWDAKGKDIYYQGESDKKLPVELNISYRLNGNNVELDDLLGKKGHVEIELNYVNNEKHTLIVNGTYQTLYTPFIVTVGTIISNEVNTNINVANGRVVSNGKNSFVVGVASPGLYESLGIDELKDFNKINISFDTDKFELPSIYSVITSNLIKKEDLNVFDRLDTIYTKVDELSSSSKKLVEGTNKLLEGTRKLSEGVNTLSTGINKAYLGSKQLNNALEQGIEDTKNTSIDETLVKTQAIEGIETYISAVQKKVNDAETAKPDLVDLYTYDICHTSPVPACAEPGVQEYLKYKAVLTMLGNEDIKNVVKSVTSEVAYEAVVKTAEKAKEATLNSLTVLNENVGNLTNGLNELNNGANSLVEGTSSLTSGIDTLVQGLSKFDSEGISAISNLVNGDVKTTEEKIKKLIELGSLYNNFTLKSDNTDSETKFVLVVDSVKYNKNAKSKKEITKKDSSLNKFKK